jgi:amino acid adenylation domain-containing protein
VVSNPTPETYSRLITPDDWSRFSTPRGLVLEIQLCVEGDGVIDPRALSAAVAVASQACPGARLVHRGRWWVDSGTAPVVKVAEAADFDRMRLESPLLRHQMTCYRSSCEVVLVQGAPTTVIFRAHAGVMDAQGAMLWQRQVFRALRGEAVEDVTSRLNRDEAMAEIAARLGIDLPPAVGSQPGPEWRPLVGPLPSGRRRSLWHRRTIDGIHAGVTAKIARLITAYGDGRKDGLVVIPMDLRQYLPGLRSTAGLSGIVDILVREDDDWSDVNACLLTALSEHQFLSHRGDPALLNMPAPLMRENTRWIDTLARQNPDFIKEQKLTPYIAAISHLGEVDLADFCADGFEATSCYSLGTSGFSPGLDLIESGGRTEVTVAWRAGPGVAEQTQALLDWIQEGLSPRDHRVWDANRTDHEAPPATLSGLFAKQVSRSPDAVAISSTEGELTYAGLSAHAAAVTAALQARGIGRGDRVGLVAGRSPAAIAAIWGILAAGAAYLPIDASYPDTRITGLLTDAQAPVCLLEPPHGQRDLLPAGCQPITLGNAPAPLDPLADVQAVQVQPDDVACVIYTSGSTGTPKGVEIEHRALVNYVRWATREARIDATTRMPLIASLAFDMAGCAIYLPLLNGGTVLPVPDVNAATLRHAIEDRGATAIAITPSHLDLINHSGITRSTMRVIMTAGELLRRSTALRAREIFGPHCAILCQWGPTETTIVNTSHTFDPDTDTDAGVPFGRPMDNNTVYLLDRRGRHVPPGEPGEACVGGTQLARGYLGRPDLTWARFTRLADGTRIYRTGDIARRLPDGDLVFIARTDDQVKIAGHRIEPAEIAQALEDHPDVRQAVVIPRTRPGRHDKELCAYITGDTGASPADLKEFLAARLPRHMIPAAIIAVPEIPRTPNGKTDARQLPDPFSSAPSTDAPVSHRDHITSTVAGIWARTLQVDPHLIYDQTDFRELGGTSMLMLTMIDEVSRTVAGDAQAEFMAELDQLIREPTLGRLSEIARQTRISHLARQQANVR